MNTSGLVLSQLESTTNTIRGHALKLTTLVTACLVSAIACIVHAEVSVRPISLSIEYPLDEELGVRLFPLDRRHDGTKVSLWIHGIEPSVFGIDREASSVFKMTDSTGRDLLARPRLPEGQGIGGYGHRRSIEEFSQISLDGRQLVLNVTAPGVPAQGADSISIESNLVLLAASSVRAVRAEGVPAVPGPVKVGEHVVHISRYEPADEEGGRYKLSLRMDRAFQEAVDSWTITDEEGVALTDGPSIMSEGGDSVWLLFELHRGPERLNIEVKLFDAVERIEVPLSVEVGLGGK
jgi:hypothetical protein